LYNNLKFKIMYFTEKIKELKTLLVEEILSNCEGKDFMDFSENPFVICEDSIVEIHNFGKVVAKDEIGTEIEGDINSYSVEDLCTILDEVQKQFNTTDVWEQEG